MADTITGSMDDVLNIKRKISDWTSPKGLNTEIVPWRLWEKAKKSGWDPADIDFSQDAQDWQNLEDQQKFAIATLANGFMVGEESVTLDIIPLLIALSDQNRVEEVIYLTSFAMDEARHVDFFRRWFSAVGFDPSSIRGIIEERFREAGLEPPSEESQRGIFEEELPKVMRRVLVDRSPQAILDCSITYNQFVEGCLAISGYKIWANIFEMFGVLPGMQEGLRYVRRDEGRHITYGTYLTRRIIAANPDLLPWAKERLDWLRDYYFQDMYDDRLGEPDEQALFFMDTFRDHVTDQVERRKQVLEQAAALSEEAAEKDLVAEEAEEELETVPS